MESHGLFCPKCGEREKIAPVGGGQEKACAYGIDSPINLAEHDALSTQPVT